MRYLIEGEQAWQTLEGDHEPRAVWYTTSPWVLERWRQAGRRVESLETAVGAEIRNAAGEAARRLADSVAEHLDTVGQDAWGIPALGVALRASLFRQAGVVLYKSMLLERWLASCEADQETGCVVGSLEDLAPNSFTLALPRFGTLFAALAARSDLPPQVSVRATPGAERARSSARTTPPIDERALSLLNPRLDILLYRCWKTLGGRGWQLRRRPTMDVMFYKDCELLREVFPILLRKGARVRQLSPIRASIAPSLLTAPCQPEALLSKMCEHLGQPLPRTGSAALSVLAEQLCGALAYAPATWEAVENQARIVKKSLIAPGAVVTNGLSTPVERLLKQALTLMAVPVVAFDHGLGPGLSSHHLAWKGDTSLDASDLRVLYTEAAEKYHRPSNAIVAGLPELIREPALGVAQRSLARLRVRVGLGEPLITFVASPYGNNMIRLPYGASDLEYHLLRSKVLEILGRLNHACLLKLYPGQRYVDPDPALAGYGVPPNVRVLHGHDFRYLRTAADVIIIDTPYSALAWAWTSGKPLIYLDTPYNPLLPEAAEAFDHAIFRVDCTSDQWPNHLESLLREPRSKLLHQWESRAAARLAAGEHYVVGPPGTPGALAAEAIQLFAAHPNLEDPAARPRLGVPT